EHPPRPADRGAALIIAIAAQRRISGEARSWVEAHAVYVDVLARRQQRALGARIGDTERLDRIDVLDNVAEERHRVGMTIEVAALVQRIGIDHRREVSVL